jgi:hypothetical protein
MVHPIGFGLPTPADLMTLVFALKREFGTRER